MVNQRETFKWGVPLFAALLFFGALFWAKSDDPFRRVEFTLRTKDFGKAQGIVVLPKPERPLPVVVYLHGSEGSLLTSGKELRQLAELGVAAVGLEYDQTNQAGFDEQFLALSEYLKDKSWAQPNATAWVGFSLGAQRTLSFIIKHPEVQPQLMVRLAGGWLPELDALQSASNGQPLVRGPVLMVNGTRDEVFAPEDAKRLAELLRKGGTRVEEKLVDGETHGFGNDRALMFRLIAEYCRAALSPGDPFQGVERRRIVPLWVWLIPAFLWAAFGIYRWRKGKAQENAGEQTPLKGWEKGLRWVAAVMAILAVGETGIHLITPRLATGEGTLGVARRWLVAPKWTADFNYLSANTIWLGKPLRQLLDNVELANYNRNELINWKVEDGVYQKFVLTPNIAAGADGELNWRRPLWESFYPRIRKEDTPEAAAEIVARYLRERVTMAANCPPTAGVESIWKSEIANEAGFEEIYVAALRSVGVGARLGTDGKAEYWTGDKWTAAPRPAVSSLLPGNAKS